MNKNLHEILISCPFIIDYSGERLGEPVKNNVIISSDMEEGLLHEMAHLVEIPSSRMFLPYYGMKNSHSSNYKDILREIRVHCYQYNVCQAIDMPYAISAKQWGLSFVKGFKFVPGDSNDEKYSFLDSHIKNIIHTFTVDSFFQEWNNKCNIVRSLN
jgi:hypothetical protein